MGYHKNETRAFDFLEGIIKMIIILKAKGFP
jgi:hypothetical protein